MKRVRAKAIRDYGDFELKPCVKCGGRKFSTPVLPECGAILQETACGRGELRKVPHVSCLSCGTVQYLHFKGSGWSTNAWCGDPQAHYHSLNKS